MNVLLDECVPWPMHKLLSAHVCATAQRLGWGGIKNGDLLRLAEGKFDLFITSDQNIRYQQNLAGAASQFSNSQPTSSGGLKQPRISFEPPWPILSTASSCIWTSRDGCPRLGFVDR